MGKFAYLLLPPEAAEVARNFTPAGRLPARVLAKVFSLVPPVRVSVVPEVRSTYGQAGGWFLSIPLDAGKVAQIPEMLAARQIIRAGTIARKAGAGVMGLGTLGSAGGGALSAAENSLQIRLAAGNGYTLAAALEGCKQAAHLMGYSIKNVRAAVLGAAGPVGRACAQILAKDVRGITLVGGERRRLEDLAGKLYFESGLSAGITPDARRALRSADLVVVAAEAEGAAVGPGDLAPGAVVCNLAGAPGVNLIAGSRDDVLVMEGGVVAVPGNPGGRFLPGLPPGMVCPSMAEAMLLAMEEDFLGFSPGGPVSSEQVKKIASLAARHGFKLAGFKVCGRFLAPGEIEKTRLKAMKKIG